MPWLTILGALPLLGAVVAALVRGRGRVVAGLVFSVVTFGLAIWAAVRRADLGEIHSWIPQIGASYALRLDGLAAMLVLVSTLLVVVVMLTRVTSVRDSEGEWRWFIPLALALEGLGLFTFLADDVLIFLIAFEATLFPMYFLIAAGGQARRSAAAMKFLLYSLAGGLVLLGGIVYLMVKGNGLTFEALAGLPLAPEAERVLFLAFFVAFAVKAPLVPLHPWLPDAVEHAQPASSVLLVGMLDAIGLYGMVRFCLGITPQGAVWASTAIVIVAVITVVYGALAAIASRSLMRLAAFTSISHAGFMVLGLFAFTTASLSGAMTYVGAHALSASALILAAGWTVSRRGDALAGGSFGGLARPAPVLAGVFLLSGLATLALPGTANFAAELSIIVGAWARHPIIVAIGLLGVLAAGVYVLWAYQRVFTGTPSDAGAEVPAEPVSDITRWSRLAIGLLLAGVLAFGILPGPAQHLVADNVKQSMPQGMSDPEGGR